MTLEEKSACPKMSEVVLLDEKIGGNINYE